MILKEYQKRTVDAVRECLELLADIPQSHCRILFRQMGRHWTFAEAGPIVCA